MSRPTTDATVSSIAYEGDFITSEMRLDVFGENNSLLHSRDIKIIPGLTVREKFLLVSFIIPTDGSNLAVMEFTNRVYDKNTETLLGEVLYSFNPEILDESGKEPYDFSVDLTIQQASVTLSGTLTIKFCVHNSTDLGKINELINNIECICKYLNDVGVESGTKQSIYNRINALGDYLELLDLTSRPSYSGNTNTTNLIVDSYSTGERYCNQLQYISYWLNLIKNSPSGLTDIELIELKKLVYDLYTIFIQNVPSQYCDPTGVLWPAKKTTHIIQSPDLFIQASGSDGNDGVTSGVLLRWSLNGDLGNHHLPKGRYAYNDLLDGNPNPYKTAVGYSNNDDDFVKIYRIKYENPTYFNINFDQTISNIKIIDIGDNIDEFIFKISDRIVVFELIQNNYLVNTVNILTYNALTETYTCTSLKDFIEVYNDVFSIAIYEEDIIGNRSNVLKSFGVRFKLIPDVNALLQTDEVLLTTFEGSDPQVKYNLKQPILKQDASEKKFFTESIQKVHIKKIHAEIDSIDFEFYDDFLYNPSRSWAYQGQYSLSLDESQVEERLNGLDDTYDINKNWPKYNDGVSVNASNYMDKWLDVSEGFKLQVENYLALSKVSTNLKAVNTQAPVLSFLNLLKLQSLDFHVARMLGLATIDIVPIDNADSYIYMAFYKAPSAQGIDINDGFLEHIYMTLPTNKSDYRLPFIPSLDSFSHNYQATSEDVMNDEGYSHFENSRLIDINRNKLPYEFANSHTPYSLLAINNGYFNLGGDKTKPYSIGIEYGLININSDFELPNVSYNKVYLNGTDYKDYKGEIEIDETLLVLDRSNPIYTHLETNTGLHNYALYGVNWFSRASVISNELSLETTFVNKNIKPPVNLQAQYIQKEDPLVFTSIAEQTELQQKIDNQVAEPNLTRVTFDWNGYQNGNYQFAQEVHFYFRKNLPEEVRGKVNTISVVSGTGQYLITTDKIKLISQDGSFMEPVVSSPQKMIGSELKTKSGAFKIVSCETDVQGFLKFTIEPIKTTSRIEEVDQLTGKINYRPKLSTLLPKINEFFTVRANETLEADWYKLVNSSNKVIITNFVDTITNTTYSEEYTNDDGVLITQVVGGIFKTTATVIKLDEEETGVGDLYEIIIPYTLSLIPLGNGTNVNYFEGSVRVKTNSNKIRELRVFSITGFGETELKLLVHDSNADSLDPIKTSGIDFVNFHPGYKIYLSSEGEFSSSNIEPITNGQIKKTWIAAKSFDGGNDYYLSNPFDAPFSTHVSILATKESIPLETGDVVLSSKFATKPDVFGKSSYSIDLLIGIDKPFATAFYRTTDNAILQTIYSSAALTLISSNLKNIEINNAEDKRFNDLVNAVLNDLNNGFKEYNGYALPLPDLVEIEGSDSSQIIVNKIKHKIQSSFLPITHEPCIYSFIKQRNSGITSNRKPTLVDDSGKLLVFNNPSFDPYPFITKINTGDDLRFTDYTLQGASNARYFYAFKHQSDNLKMSDWSGIIGPVNLINSASFEAPVIEKFEIILANKLLESKASVRFTIQPYPDSTGVSKIRLYRAFTSSAAKNILAMDIVGDFDIAQNEIIDTFSLMIQPPTEEDIFYRVVGLKEVRCEKKIDELDVDSEYTFETYCSSATDPIIIQLPDNTNPDSATLSCTCTGNNLNKLQNVVIEFESVMYKGEYYLYKLNPNGSWSLIDQFTNSDNTQTLFFDLGDLEYTDNVNIINHLFKVIACNKSGLFSLDDNQINPISHMVPSPLIIGTLSTCVNQATVFKTVKSSPSNLLEWKLDNNIVGTSESLINNWSTTGTFLLEVKETNQMSSLYKTHTIQVLVKQSPIPIIIGVNNTCTNVEVYYETIAVTGNFYNWIVDGGQIISGQGTNLVSVVWSSAGIGSIKVQESNGGCVIDSSVLDVTILTKPNPIITAENYTVCTGHQLQIDSNEFDPSNSYIWQLTDGQIISQDSGILIVTWDTEGEKNISVLVGNGNCTVESNPLTIIVQSPPQASNINGPVNPHIGIPINYNSTNYQSGNFIEWSISSNGIINSGQGTDTIEVTWQSGAANEWVEVIESNSSCSPSPMHLDINIVTITP